MLYKWKLKQKLEHIGKNPVTVASGTVYDEENCMYEASLYLSNYINESDKTILVIEKVKDNN